MSPLVWERYVAELCLDSWSLAPASLIKVMADIESLIAAGQVTVGSIATVLRMAGVSRADADLMAPSIHALIGDGDTPPHAFPP